MKPAHRTTTAPERPTSAGKADPSASIKLLEQENVRMREQLVAMRNLAFRDQLTGLYSRRYLTDYLEHEIAAASKDSNVVLALCDIDDFKNVNDTFGHRSGDIAIVCVADILDDLAGGQPVIRWGGEELLIVYLSTPEADALRVCNEMRRETAAYRIHDGVREFSCTLTFGVGSYNPNLTFAENFALVDQALYRGKEAGKNRCESVRRTHGAQEA